MIRIEAEPKPVPPTSAVSPGRRLRGFLLWFASFTLVIGSLNAWVGAHRSEPHLSIGEGFVSAALGAVLIYGLYRLR